MKPEYIPFVSIIMPIRNEAAYIERSLESVLAQNYPVQKLELLVVDGNSDDGTKDKITQLCKLFPNHLVASDYGLIVLFDISSRASNNTF